MACLGQLNFEWDTGHHLLAVRHEEGVWRKVCRRGKDNVTWFGKPENTEKCREGVTLRRETDYGRWLGLGSVALHGNWRNSNQQ